jgi:hypothetical protein
MQLAQHILMVRPAHFGFNQETAVSNAFQLEPLKEKDVIQKEAETLFDKAVKMLKANNIDVHVFQDSSSPIKPDAIFPNNWLSLHIDGTVVIYPMSTPNRRAEVNLAFVEKLRERFLVKRLIDLSPYADDDQFLEGTGSIVFDHANKIAYACLSERTNQLLLTELCEKLNYTPISFHAYDESGLPIYHTNVLMCVGKGFVTLCLDAVTEADKSSLMKSFKTAELEVIEISRAQMAASSLTKHQIQQLERHGKLLPIDVSGIEQVAGGSIRCMIAEIFLPEINV